MKLRTRPKKYNTTCDYCNEEFETSMPFSLFCSDNHRKYYANWKTKYLKKINQESINISDLLIEDLLKLGYLKTTTVSDILKKVKEVQAKLEEYQEVKDNIDYYVKRLIKKENKKR